MPTDSANINIAVLASGSGTNLEAIAQAIDEVGIPARVAVVISDNPGAFALERAARRHIPAKVIELKDFPDRQAFDHAVLLSLREAQVDLVVLAGYMKLVGNEIVEAFRGA